MGARVAQLSLFAVALIIGALLVGQLRSQARPIELSSLSAQELAALVETLQARNVELADGLADLREQVRDYERAEIEGSSNQATGQESLAGIRAFGGQLAVRGQGVVFEAEGSFDPTHLNDIIHELRNAGAEAIAVDDIRITARSVAVLGTSAIEIDGVEIGRSFEVSAIGSPDGLASTLVRPDGMLSLIARSTDARFSEPRQVRDLIIPATRRDLAPQAARAVE
ncbi:MAG: DUF881 domain-containing protein [Chloroflexota bacterium]|jgi:uncharacterized protein YlxW (UPF0749 family)|nr:DUF881 domain-containing protein [Chloroflexota bacterium]